MHISKTIPITMLLTHFPPMPDSCSERMKIQISNASGHSLDLKKASWLKLNRPGTNWDIEA